MPKALTGIMADLLGVPCSKKADCLKGAGVCANYNDGNVTTLVHCNNDDDKCKKTQYCQPYQCCEDFSVGRTLARQLKTWSKLQLKTLLRITSLVQQNVKKMFKNSRYVNCLDVFRPCACRSVSKR